MNLGLEGKTVVVTGGSGGIGRGLVLGFAEEGCNVVDRDARRRAGPEGRRRGEGAPGPRRA